MSKKKINYTTKKVKIVKKLLLKYIIKKCGEKIFLIKTKFNGNNCRIMNEGENQVYNNENNHSNNNYSGVLEQGEEIDYNKISDSTAPDNDFWARISDSDNRTRNVFEEDSTEYSEK